MGKIIKIIIGLLVLLFAGAYALYYQATIPPTRADNPIVTGINYVGMTVSDLKRSTKLYQDSANLQVKKSGTIESNIVIDELAGREGVTAQTALMNSVNAQLRFMQFDSPSKSAQHASFVDANGPGIAHVCYQVNQKTQAYDKFLAGGGTHIGEREITHLNPKNPVYYAYARDIDNTMVEIEHVDVDALNLAKPPKNDYRVRHVSLATTDMDRIVGFYSTLLETKNPRRAGRLLKLKGENVDKVSGFANSELEMAWFQVRNLELEIVQYTNPAPIKPAMPRPIDATGYNMIVFNVTDLAAVKEKLIAAGGSVEIESGKMDGAEILFGRDPDGNLIGFQALNKESPYSAKQFANNGIG